MQAQARSKSKKVSVPYLVALDIGFGELKYLSNATEAPMTIPSAVVPGAKPGASRLFDLETVDPGALIVTTSEGTNFVGAHAMRIPTSGSKRTQVRDRAADPASRVLFKTGVALSLPHEEGEYDVFLVTGLPNDDFELSIKKNLEEFLLEPFEVTVHLGENRSITKTINITGLDIVRQPEGAVTHNQFKFDRENFVSRSDDAKASLGVIDLGHFTTDFALFQEGVIIESENVNGSTVGVTEMYNKLRRKLGSYFDGMGYDFRATDSDLDLAVRTKQIQYMGAMHDIADLVDQSAAEVAKTIAKAVLDAWGNETNRLDAIKLTGGGSFVFGEHLEREFLSRKKQGFTTLDYPQYGNSIGFYVYGCLSLADELSVEDVFEAYVTPVFGETE